MGLPARRQTHKPVVHKRGARPSVGTGHRARNARAEFGDGVSSGKGSGEASPGGWRRLPELGRRDLVFEHFWSTGGSARRTCGGLGQDGSLRGHAGGDREGQGPGEEEDMQGCRCQPLASQREALLHRA